MCKKLMENSVTYIGIKKIELISITYYIKLNNRENQ